MKRLIRKFALGTASVVALGIAGAALDYAAEPANTANAESMPAAAQSGDNLLPSAEMRKDDIRWAQVELRTKGFYEGSLDGVLGPRTKQALERFQKANGLERTALLDAQTWESLTGDTGIAAGSSLPSGTDRAGSMGNSFGASNAGR